MLQAEPSARQELLVEQLKTALASVLRLPASKVETETSIVGMGLDSLMAVELQARLERDLQVKLPVVKLLEGPSLTKLAAMVLEKLVADAPAAPAPKAMSRDDAQALLDRVSELSDEQVSALLGELAAKGD